MNRQNLWEQGDEVTYARLGCCWKDECVLCRRLWVAQLTFATAILYKLKLNQSVTTIPTGLCPSMIPFLPHGVQSVSMLRP